MKRVAIVADSHFCEDSRFEECVRVHDWIAQDIAVRGVDLVLHSGDVYERKSTPMERRAVATWVQCITDVAPLIIVRGNHDALGDLPLLEKLSTAHPVRVVEGATTIGCFAGIEVGCLAWPTKASVLALGAESHAEGELLAGDALRNVLRGLGQQMSDVDDGAPRILLAHAMVRGSVTSTGQPLVGCDLEVGLEDIALANADFVALGHIHKGQDWQDGANRPVCPVVYPGSPRRTTHGELESKGYVIAEFDGRECVGWMRVETPCAPMIDILANWVDDHDGARLAVSPFPVPDVDTAEVRVRYVVEPDKRAAAKAAAAEFRDRLLAAGAVNVKVVEEVESSGTARAPEVALAVTLADKLRAYWTARQTSPEKPREARLLGKAAELEENVHAL